jgi:hypothetical protein
MKMEAFMIPATRWQAERANGNAIIAINLGILQENAAFLKGKEPLKAETVGTAEIQAAEKVIRAENRSETSGKLAGRTGDIRVASEARHEQLTARMRTTASRARVAADLLGNAYFELAMEAMEAMAQQRNPIGLN